MLNDKIAYTDEMLATIFRRPVNIVRLALNTFEQFGMIEIVNNTYTIPNWDKHQNIDKLEKMKEQTRLRVAKHREKQKLLSNGNEEDAECNVTVTLRNDTDKIRKEEEKKEKENNKKATASADAINSYTDYEPLRNAVNEFVKMRKTIKAPLTDHALKLMLNKLDKLSTNDDIKILILNQSIANCWKGIYELKEDYKGGGNNGFNKNEYGKADADSKFADWQPSGGVL